MTVHSSSPSRLPHLTAVRVDRPLYAAAVTIYLAGQAIAVGMLTVLSRAGHLALLDRLTAWDGQHFLDIANQGYVWSALPGNPQSPAFFPGYPVAVAGIRAVTHLPTTAVALGLSWIAGAVFACAVACIAHRMSRSGQQLELIAVALVAVSPMSIVFAMAYSEALFCALAGWALVAALDKRWLTAGVIAFFAGLVRISGLALALAFVAVAIAEYARGSGRGAGALRSALKPCGAAVLAAAGTLAWIVGSGLAMGSPTAWFAAQNAGWDSHWDFGSTTVRFLYRMATTAPHVFEVCVAILTIAACVLVVCSFRQRQPLALAFYGAIAVAEVVGSAGLMSSKARLLLPAFTILLPVAAWLARLRPSQAALALGGIGLLGTWIGACGLAIWPYAI